MKMCEEAQNRLNDIRQMTGKMPSSRGHDRDQKAAMLARVPKCTNPKCGGRHPDRCPVSVAEKDPSYDAKTKAELRCNYVDPVTSIVCQGRSHLARHHLQSLAENSSRTGGPPNRGPARANDRGAAAGVTPPRGTKDTRGPRQPGSQSNAARPKAKAKGKAQARRPVGRGAGFPRPTGRRQGSQREKGRLAGETSEDGEGEGEEEDGLNDAGDEQGDDTEG